MIYAFGDADKSKVNLGNAADLPYNNDTLIDNIKKVNKKTEYTTLASGKLQHDDKLNVTSATISQYSELTVFYYVETLTNKNYYAGSVSFPVDLLMNQLLNVSGKSITLLEGDHYIFSLSIFLESTNNAISFAAPNCTFWGDTVIPTFRICAK